MEQGYQVTGVMMRLWSEVAAGVASSNKCCSLEAVDDARRVADLLGIPFYLINVEQPFKQRVVDLDYLATGHYARVRKDGKGRGKGGKEGQRSEIRGQNGGPGAAFELLKGVDVDKDQSYILHVLTQEILARVLFPVGEYTKPQVRDMAAERGLPVASRHESQDLCFLADGDYRRFDL